MKQTLYNLEVGILLNEDDEDFNCYNKVYNKVNSYYDENEIVYLKEDYNKAIEYAKDYVKKGVNRTYAILTNQGLFKIEEKDIKEIKENGTSDYFELDYNCKNVCYSIFKNDNGEIIDNFIEIKEI